MNGNRFHLRMAEGGGQGNFFTERTFCQVIHAAHHRLYSSVIAGRVLGGQNQHFESRQLIVKYSETWQAN